MAVKVELEAPIARSCGDVFAHLADVRRYPEWLVASGIVRAESVGTEPLGPGSTIQVEQRIAGRAAILEGSVTAFEPARQFAFRAKDREGIGVEIEGRLAPDGAACRLRWSVSLELPLKYRFFESMIAPEVRAAATADLERFRRLLSAVAG